MAYYRETKQRVRLPITPELMSWVKERIAAARETAVGAIPPPLVASPKCPRCSLVTVCLPDETRFLAASAPAPIGTPDSALRSPSAICHLPSAIPTPDRTPDLSPQPSTLNPQPDGVRRLIAARDDARALYLTTQGRNRRPPTDPVNALLSLAYSLLAKDCLLAALAVGFDPYVGFYHQPRFGRPALALDLMEEFRPLVAESAVLTCINNRMVSEGDFVQAGQAVNLTAAGRKRFFQAYEQRMSALLTHPVFDYKVSYRRALELQARLLAKVLTGEIPEYVPLTTR